MHDDKTGWKEICEGYSIKPVVGRAGAEAEEGIHGNVLYTAPSLTVMSSRSNRTSLPLALTISQTSCARIDTVSSPLTARTLKQTVGWGRVEMNATNTACTA